jgi:hypothetical protein
MANILNDSNSAPSADSVLVFKKLPSGWAPKATLKQIDNLSGRISKLETERAKWLTPCANAEILRRREAVKADPSQENLLAVSTESNEQLVKRYEATADTYHRLLSEMSLGLVEHYAAVLAALLPALDAVIERATAEQAKTAAAYGVKHDAAADPLLRSLARLKGCAVDRLSSHVPMHVADFKAFTGLTGSGFFG